jgi:hypothetical protein
MRTILLVAGSLLAILSAAMYVISILERKSKPQRMTRFLMVVITALMVGPLWVAGDTSGVWLALTSFLQAVLVLVLTFRYGMGGRSRLDMLCVVLCCVGMICWLVSGQSWSGLVASVVADFVAVIPSLHKTVRLPHTELALFYILDVVAGVCILLAGPFTLEAMFFPVYVILINAVFVAAIQWPRKHSFTD